MRTILKIGGKPQGKARPRVTRRGAYTPKKTKEYEAKIRAAWQEQAGATFEDRPVMVRIFAYFKPPKSASKVKRARMIAGEIRPTMKPDADNIAKAVCDALNGLAYKDDSQVVALAVFKRYEENERIEVIIQDSADSVF